MFRCYLLFIALVASASSFQINTSITEQYAAALAWDQHVPLQALESPLMGIIYMTVTPLQINSMNSSDNTYIIDTFLYHNVNSATDAAIWGADARGDITDSMRLLSLFQSPDTPVSVDCPLYTTHVVYYDVVQALRNGMLFAVVETAELSPLRGQIETRNDIYFAPITSKNDTGNVTRVAGAALLRMFNIQGHTYKDIDMPVGIDAYVISSEGASNDYYGVSLLTNLPALSIGIMDVTNVVANTIFIQDMTLVFRRDLQKLTPPVFGPNSSNLILYMQDLTNLVNYTKSSLGEFIRLPLLGFDGDRVSVFTQEDVVFGASGQPSAGFNLQPFFFSSIFTLAYAIICLS